MISHFLFLLVQTIAALVVLGFAGGWALFPFRDPSRPYLWLAAPLAGISALSAGMLTLYFGCGLSLIASFLMSMLVFGTSTIAFLVREKNSRRILTGSILALPVALISSVWATLACNATAIEFQQPTLSVTEGSDMFGYAMTADWIMANPGAVKPSPDSHLEVLPYVVLHIDGGRKSAFLLNAVAAWIRGTSGCFSYDWLSGIALGAAAMGIAGLFAARPADLALLLMVALTCSWLVIARTGYMGKILAYPGCIFLSALFLWTWAQPNRTRVFITWVLGIGTAFLIHPMLPVLVLSVILGGLLSGLWGYRLARRPLTVPPLQLNRTLSYSLTGIALFTLVPLPPFLIYTAFFHGGAPPYLFDWGFIVPASLDLESPALRYLSSSTGFILTAIFLGSALLFIWFAFLQGNLFAHVYLASCALVPFAVIFNLKQLYGFHGLLYPLTMVGITLVCTQLAKTGRSSKPAWFAISIAVLLILLHLPQISKSWLRYVYDKSNIAAVIKEKEIAKLRELIGNSTVDLWIDEYRNSSAIVTELACLGTQVLLRPPAWDRTLKNWAAAPGCSLPSDWPAKGRFSVVSRNDFAPEGTVRFKGSRFKLLEDNSSVTFTGMHNLTVKGADLKGRLRFGVGIQPVAIEIYNGTNQPAAIELYADVMFSGEKSLERTLKYRLDNAPQGHIELKAGSALQLHLQLLPGRNLVSVSANPPAGDSSPALYLTNLRLNPIPR